MKHSDRVKPSKIDIDLTGALLLKMNPTRRALLSSFAASSASLVASRHGLLYADAQDRLRSVQIDSEHPEIIALAQQIAGKTSNMTHKAIAIHDWVRDHIVFGIPADFYKTTASRVIQRKIGYCNTKAIAFCALLDATHIPFRIRFIALSADVLRGLFSPGTSYVDHAIVEVGLDGNWIQTDSYVIDRALERAARERLANERQLVGYGIHSQGGTTWNGRDPAFIQALPGRVSAPYIVKEHGYFNDTLDFYRRANDAQNRIGLVSGLAIRLSARSINRQIEGIRFGV